ncbi:SDA1 domain protein (macronuclear) [Tetrahymena thermophila SB210]|uniref:Protein SDA1 n=1 Tax=Tetrahymena thermophila (strain SB210) TaxID=312017 RepID=Q23ZH1_TETTS|nr:SDA1 domain protein [Tetrahymena thermophila SB210]EAS01886.1 SDA1 domain protein [Tetrahymena thermophila SB210]|eukprot:XP_001022131.1 SDA1 domain protein [Tetrahymena thermophila SB210]
MSLKVLKDQPLSKEEKDKKKLEEEQKKEEEDFVKQLEIISYKIRKSPELYVKEVTEYYSEFKQSFEKVKESPMQKNRKFSDLCVFLARIAQFYKFDVLDTYIMEFLEHYANQMNPALRRSLAAALMIMRSKNLLKPVETTSFLLKLLNCQDKELRKMIASHIVNDIRRMNKHHKNQKINKSLQNIIFEILKNNSDGIAKRSLQIMITLYKKGIWTDQKTVNIIASGCLNDNYKIKLISCYFLVSTTEMEEYVSTDEDEEEEIDLREKKGINKKTRAKIAKREREKKKAEKRLRKRMKQNIKNNFFPIDQIYNPQDFAEKVFTLLRKSHEKFPVKMCMMSVLSRMICRHQLILLSFYSFLQKYLLPHQKEVTKILAYLAESIHKLVPPDELILTVKHVIENFVNDRCSEQAMTWGLNTIREMCVKNYHILDSPNLNYLASYCDYKNKYVSRAAKSIVNLYRQINPKLLEKKYRGKIRQDGKLKDDDGELLKYGEEYIYDTIDGAELLQEDGDVPVYMDRLLTDEDFRKIKFLKMKQAQQEELERQEKIERMKRGRLADGEDDDEDDEDDDGEGSEYDDILSGEWEDEAEEYEDSEEEDDEENEQKKKKPKKVQKAQAPKKENKPKQKDQEDEEDIEIEEDYDDVSEISEDYDEEDASGEFEELEGEDDEEEEEEIEGEDDGEEGEEEDEEEEDIIMMDESENEGEAEVEEKDKKEKKKVAENKKSDQTQKKEDNKQEQSKKLKQQNKKRKLDLEGYSSFDSDEYDEEMQGYGNIHGHVNQSQIEAFKDSRAEARKKIEEANKNKVKERWYQGPKEKGGGLSNKDKKNFKPLAMLRPKKNSEQILVKKTKQKIQQIKNQLGHFQSGKHKKTGKKKIKRQ